jgi:hypothetical protein
MELVRIVSTRFHCASAKLLTQTLRQQGAYQDRRNIGEQGKHRIKQCDEPEFAKQASQEQPQFRHHLICLLNYAQKPTTWSLRAVLARAA